MYQVLWIYSSHLNSLSRGKNLFFYSNPRTYTVYIQSIHERWHLFYPQIMSLLCPDNGVSTKKYASICKQKGHNLRTPCRSDSLNILLPLKLTECVVFFSFKKGICFVRFSYIKKNCRTTYMGYKTGSEVISGASSARFMKYEMCAIILCDY